MNKKRFIIFFFLLLCLTGCNTNNSKGNIKTNDIDEKNYNTKDYNYITCIRNTETQDDSKVDINYEIYYNEDKFVEIIKSIEKVTSSDKSILNEYKNAYKDIYSVYDGLKYYDHVIKEEDNSITSITYINYGKIDIDKLMEIEGYEDNVTVTDGKIKLEDWKTFARKYGTECKSNN